MKTLALLLAAAGIISFSPSVIQAQQLMPLPNTSAKNDTKNQSSAKSQLSDHSMRAFGLAGISLSDVQKLKLDSIREEHIAQYKAFTAGASADLKGGKRSLNAGELASLKEISKSQFATIRKILTPTQQRQFDENIRRMETGADTSLRVVQSSPAVTIPTLIPVPRGKDKEKQK